ncbi:hypothetical protein QF015_001451 [Paenarthrobacter sp. TE4293]|uniref:hypothetical protein n=1 Tax=Paenarthrobacter sp. TE4293 TaxID=3381695 RepID=UPI003D1F5EB3
MLRAEQVLRFSGWALITVGLLLLVTGVLSPFWGSVWAVSIAALSITEWTLRDREQARQERTRQLNVD